MAKREDPNVVNRVLGSDAIEDKSSMASGSSDLMKIVDAGVKNYSGATAGAVQNSQVETWRCFPGNLKFQLQCRIRDDGGQILNSQSTYSSGGWLLQRSRDEGNLIQI